MVYFYGLLFSKLLAKKLKSKPPCLKLFEIYKTTYSKQKGP